MTGTKRRLSIVLFLFIVSVMPIVAHAATSSVYLTRGTVKVFQLLTHLANRNSLIIQSIPPLRTPSHPSAPLSRFVPLKNYRRGGGGGGDSRAFGAAQSDSISPTITFSDLTKFVTDADFVLSPTSDSAGTFTFTSDHTNIISISGGTAHMPGTPGTVVITAYQAANGQYAAGSKQMTITVYNTYCIEAPCITGTCIPTIQGGLTDNNFVCRCDDNNFSGTLCDEYDDNCSEPGYCNSGECVADSDGGSCANCAPCLTGDRCQTAIINCESDLQSHLVCMDARMSVIH